MAADAQDTVSIFHFDDELDLVDWIPGTLRNHYRLQHPNWVRDDEEPEVKEQDAEFTFTFRLYRPEPLAVRYRSYSEMSYREFEARFNPAPGDVLILDLYREMGDGKLDEVGTENYRRACRHMDKDRVYILTGYPDTARAALENQLPADHLFSKPPNPRTFIDALARSLQPKVNGDGED